MNKELNIKLLIVDTDCQECDACGTVPGVEIHINDEHIKTTSTYPEDMIYSILEYLGYKTKILVEDKRDHSFGGDDEINELNDDEVMARHNKCLELCDYIYTDEINDMEAIHNGMIDIDETESENNN